MRGAVTNEVELVDNILKGNIDKMPSKSLRLLAKKYFNDGYNKEEVIAKLHEYMKKYSKNYKQKNWLSVIKGITNTVSKYDSYKLIKIDQIVITENEWNKILELNNKILERLAFTLLVYEKINEASNPNCNGWIQQNYTDIFKEASIGYTGKDVKIILHSLIEKGYIEKRMVCDSNSYHLNYVDNTSKSKIIIDNFNNIITYYYQYKFNKKYRVCEVCGIRTEQKGKKPPKYCKKCARIVDNKNRNKRKR